MRFSFHHGSRVEEKTIPALAPASVTSRTSSSSSFGDCTTDSDTPIVDTPPREIEASVRSTRKVSFGQVSFRSYPLILGDHPDCLGPPLAFDWDFEYEEHYDLEQYEADRAPRKHDEELVLDWLLRKRMLRSFVGATEDELNDRTEQCSRIRKQREQTLRGVAFRAGARHVMAKCTGGLLGAKGLKHKDRQVHLSRFQATSVAN